MDLTVGTFNLNNLFGRWNLYVDAPQTAGLRALPQSAPAAEPPRDWLSPAPATTGRTAARVRQALPDVRIIIDGELTADGIKWRTNPYDGRVVFTKKPEAQKTLADRIKAIDVDVFALQEVDRHHLDRTAAAGTLRRPRRHERRAHGLAARAAAASRADGRADGPGGTGGPYPASNPDQPPTKAWTHRFRDKGKTDYELFDQIWLSPDLRRKQTGAWINRRTTRTGDATAHDPAYVRLSL